MRKTSQWYELTPTSIRLPKIILNENRDKLELEVPCRPIGVFLAKTSIYTLHMNDNTQTVRLRKFDYTGAPLDSLDRTYRDIRSQWDVAKLLQRHSPTEVIKMALMELRKDGELYPSI